MAQCHKGASRRGRNSSLELDEAVVESAAWTLNGLLDVHAVVDHAHEDLRLPDRLIERAFDAKRKPRPTLLHSEARKDHVGGPLARRHVVGVARLNAKPKAVIEKEHTGLRANHAGAKVEIQ